MSLSTSGRKLSYLHPYTMENLPKYGKAKKIWMALEKAGYAPKKLHYNPNCWGNGRNAGWASWVCYLSNGPGVKDCFVETIDGEFYLSPIMGSSHHMVKVERRE